MNLLIFSILIVPGCLKIYDDIQILCESSLLINLVELRFGNWIICYVSFPGPTSENQWWVDRKAKAVLLKYHSTIYVLVSAEERRVNWHRENNLLDETHAIHGGGLPLITQGDGFVGGVID